MEHYLELPCCLFIFSREYVSGEIPKTITSIERILVLNNLMMRIRFGEKNIDYGYMKLLKDGILMDIFPLHKNSYKWSETGELNDRQVRTE